MSGSADEFSEEENIIIPDFEDCKLGFLYEDDDLSQEDDEESQDFYTILEPVKSEDQELFLEVLENLKNAVYADDTNDTDDLHKSCRSDTENKHKDIEKKNTATGAGVKHLSYACRLCSFVTETELKIKEHLRNDHPKRRKPKLKKFYPDIAVDENGITSITVSSSTKAHILRKLMTPNIQGKGSEIFIERLKYCDPCFFDMSNKQISEASKETSPTTKLSTSATEISTDSVNVPLVMVGKQPASDKSDTFTLISSEKQMSLKPVNASSQAISIYKCNACDYYSNNKNYLKQHMDIVHNSLRPFKCPFCDYAGKRSHALREHLIVHSSERPFECNFCNATFRKKGHLTNHIKLHNNAKTLVKCPLCKELVCESKAAIGLTGHLQTVHGTDKLYGCDLCEFIAANEPEIVEHLRDKHLKVNVYKCDRCSFDTVDKTEFENHVKSHNRSVPVSIPVNRTENSLTTTPIKPVWIKCTECGFTGQDSEVIRQHMMEHLKIESSKTDTVKAKEPMTSNEHANVINVELVAQGQNIQRTIKCQHMMEHIKTDSKTDNVNPNESMTLKERANVINVELVAQGQNIQRIIKCNECNFESPTTAVFQKHLETHKKKVDKQELESQRLSNQPKFENVILSDPRSPTKPSVMTDPVLVPMSELIQSNIVKPISLTSLQCSPPKEPPQFIQVTGKRSKEGMRFLPACSQTTSVVTSIMHDKPLVSKTRFVPSNFINSIPGSVVASNLIRVLPQMIQNQTSTSAEIGQPRVANRAIPVFQKVEQNCKQEPLPKVPVRLIPEPLIHKDGLPSCTVVEKETSDVNKSDNASEVSVPQQPLAVQTGAQFILKEIPVPRQVSLPEMPKLPPEITQLNLDTRRNSEEGKRTNLNVERSVEENLDSLRKRLASVQELIQQQEKIQRQTGTKQAQILDTRGIPQATDKSNVIYYITPVSKQNTAKAASAGVMHDSSAGRFRCTICGYTCEFQRTIKAHIWKHSGNKNVEYPMFQNGPLSIYEGDQIPKLNPMLNASSDMETVVESSPKHISTEVQSKASESTESLGTGQKTDIASIETDDKSDSSSSNLPSFIVYEESKISNVAPALAHLIAARTMVGLGERNKATKSVDNKSQELESTTQELNTINTDDVPVKMKTESTDSATKRSIKVSDEKHTEIEIVPTKKTKVLMDDDVTSPINVVVENVQSVIGHSEYTGMQSQQGSPRIPNAKSPDSGLSEETACSKATDERSVSSGFFSPIPEGRLIIDDTAPESKSLLTRNTRRTKSQEVPDKLHDETNDRSASSESVRASSQTEESAVTLLSLLKKGPNFNPACPPKSNTSYHYTDRTSQTSSPGLEDTNSTGDSDISGMKPKSGISSSLLAVIEQLRERSKSDIEDEKPQVPVPTKKASKRRSRRGSIEDNSSAVEIDNVEQFMSEGEIKYRCKLCHYNNESTVLLRQHMRLHKTKQPFECSLCDVIADSSEALQDHMIQHCKVRLYQCKMCPSTFNYKSQLRAHMRAHSDLDILMCDLCDFETRSVSSLRVHMKTHENMPRFTCNICKDVFLSSVALRGHKRRCFPVDNNTTETETTTYRCNQCEFIAMDENELKYHRRGHKIVEQTLKKCPYCEHTAASVEQVQHHISSVHGENKHMKCELCGFVALSIRSLKSHMKRHVNDQRFVQQPLEQYKCNLCGYVCHHLPSLKSHMWRHAADEHYSYEFTNEIINSAIDFDGHTDAQDTTEGDVSAFRRLIHNTMKARGIENTKETTEKSAHALCWVTFRCCQCGFETINKAELNMHMKAHSDVIRWTLEVSQEPEEEDSEK